jgi:hypothetical protein
MKFKLKKDGKTVGYARFEKYRPQYNNDLCLQSNRDGIEWYDNEPQFEYDSIHPFVCADKNREDVFADDKFTFEHIGYMSEPAVARFDKIEMRWYAITTKNGFRLPLSQCKDIELIKEPEK